MIAEIQTKATTDAEKDEARARVLARVIELGPLEGTKRELRELLGLTDMSMKRFSSSCWLLREGASELGLKPQITVSNITGAEYGVQTFEAKRYRIRALGKAGR